MMVLAIESAVLGWALYVTLVFVLSGMILAFIRLMLGPSLPDRVVALELITTLSVMFIGIFTVASNQNAFLDVAIGVALISFLATVAFAGYAAQRGAPRGSSSSGPDREEKC